MSEKHQSYFLVSLTLTNKLRSLSNCVFMLQNNFNCNTSYIPTSQAPMQGDIDVRIILFQDTQVIPTSKVPVQEDLSIALSHQQDSSPDSYSRAAELSPSHGHATSRTTHHYTNKKTLLLLRSNILPCCPKLVGSDHGRTLQDKQFEKLQTAQRKISSAWSSTYTGRYYTYDAHPFSNLALARLNNDEREPGPSSAARPSPYLRVYQPQDK